MSVGPSRLSTFHFIEEGAAAETAETARAWGGDTYPRRAESAAAGRTVTV
jgi:adenine-specific DNA glycosylase